MEKWYNEIWSWVHGVERDKLTTKVNTRVVNQQHTKCSRDIDKMIRPSYGYDGSINCLENGEFCVSGAYVECCVS